MRCAAPGTDFLTDYGEWLRVQDGQSPRARLRYEAEPRFVATGRDLAIHGHQAPPLTWAAALLLAAPANAEDPRYGGLFPAARPALSPTSPIRRSRTQGGAGASFGLPWFQALVALGITYATRASYWQKWYLHRTLRPEAYAGLVHHRLAGGVADYPPHEDVLRSEALERSRARHGTHLLPQAFPDAAPMHSPYPGGAPVVSAVSATLLKAFFDEGRVIEDPVQPDPRDPTRLVPYAGPPLTVGGELNKLALNYGMGRDWAGIHWRSDLAAAMALGEEVAIGLLRDERAALREDFEGFAFTRFDGTRVTV
jgi:hypothetical protein